MTDKIRAKLDTHFRKHVRSERAKMIFRLLNEGMSRDQAEAVATRRVRAAMLPKVEALSSDFPIHKTHAESILRNALKETR